MVKIAHGGREHTITSDGIEVTRRLETDGKGVVGTLDVTSTADDPVLIELVEQWPEELTVESMAFKPDAAPDFESASSDSITIRHTVGDAPVQIIYGILLAEEVDELRFDPPTIQAVEPTGAVRSESASTGGGESFTLDDPTEDEGSEDDDAPSGSVEAAFTSVEEAVSAAEAEATAQAETEDDEPASGPEIDHIELLEEEDATDDGPRRSVDLRLDRLSARVEEFATYSEALEDLIDEHGTTPELFDRIEERIDGLDERIEETHGELEADIEAARESYADELDERRAAVDEELSEVRAELDERREEVARLTDEVEEMRGEIAGLTDEVREFRRMRESLAATFAGAAPQQASTPDEQRSTVTDEESGGGAPDDADGTVDETEHDEDPIEAAVTAVERDG